MGITKHVRAKRREEAEKRNEAYSKLTLTQKLARQSPGGKVATKLAKLAK